jgi:hypothetical protein
MGGICSALSEIGRFYRQGTISVDELAGLRAGLDRYFFALHRARQAIEACTEPEAGAIDIQLLAAALEDLCFQRCGLADVLQPLLIYGAKGDRDRDA